MAKITNLQPKSFKLQSLSQNSKPKSSKSLLLSGPTVSDSQLKSKISLALPRSLHLSKSIIMSLLNKTKRNKMLCLGLVREKQCLRHRLKVQNLECQKMKLMQWCPEALSMRTCFSRKNPFFPKKLYYQLKHKKSRKISKKRNQIERVFFSIKTQTKNKISHSRKRQQKKLKKKNPSKNPQKRNLNKKNQTLWG